MERILVTGGAGFIGSHTVRTLLDSGVEIVVLDPLHQYVYPIQPSYLENMRYRFEALLKGATVMRGTTLNKDDLRRLIIEVRPSRIVHFAALPLANLSIRNSGEAFDSILQGTVNILEVLRDVDFVERLVYVSSSLAYGDFATSPVKEEAQKEPKEIYGGMKLAGEILTKVFSSRYGFDHAIVRPSAVYGPTDNNRRVLQIFVENAFKGEPLRLKNGATTYLDFTYVKDTAHGVQRTALGAGARNETFNITRGEACSLMEAAMTIKQMFADVVIEDESVESFYPERGALDISKAQRLLGYSPQYSLGQGLEEYVGFMRRENTSIVTSDSGLRR